MTAPAPSEQALVIDRHLAHRPDKVWRALTEEGLMARWLMANDFRAEVGHHFQLRSAPSPRWDGVTACEVLEVSPLHRLSYRCSVAAEPQGLTTTVTWSLTPTEGGTLLRLEQAGFQPTQERNRQGAKYSWTRHLEALSSLLNEL